MCFVNTWSSAVSKNDLDRITWHLSVNFCVLGRGVFACAPIEKGSFVVEYRGELISQYERDKRQKKYTEKENVFLFDFEWNNSSWW